MWKCNITSALINNTKINIDSQVIGKGQATRKIKEAIAKGLTRRK